MSDYEVLCLEFNAAYDVACLRPKGHDGAHAGVKGSAVVGWATVNRSAYAPDGVDDPAGGDNE